MRSCLRSGRWQQLQHGVYATFTGEPGRQAVLWAAVLRAGRSAVLSHYTAAELHALTDWSGSSIHVTIPESRRIAPIRGVVLHLSQRAEVACHPTQLPPRTRIEETILDLTQVAATAEDACAWIARGLGRRLTTQDRLGKALGHRQRTRFRAELSEALSEDFAGVHAALEYRYVKLVELPHCLPKGQRQAPAVRDGRRETAMCCTTSTT